MKKYTAANVNDFDPEDIPVEDWDDYLAACHERMRREGLHVFGDDPNDYLEEYAEQRLFHEDGDEEFFHEYDEYSDEEPAHTAWEARKQQLDAWLADSAAADDESRLRDAANPRDPLNRHTFTWHPRYTGRSALEVFYEFRQMARQAKVTYTLFSEHPAPSATMRAVATTVEEKWAPFGGTQGIDADVHDLATVRLVLEIARDQLKTMDYTLADFHRGQADYQSKRRAENRSVKVEAWTFKHNPRFRGQTIGQVRDHLRRAIREDQARFTTVVLEQILVRKPGETPGSSPKEIPFQQERDALNAKGQPFGGSDWGDWKNADQVARARLCWEWFQEMDPGVAQDASRGVTGKAYLSWLESEEAQTLRAISFPPWQPSRRDVPSWWQRLRKRLGTR